MSLWRFLFLDHLGPACLAAFLCALGVAGALPVVRYGPDVLLAPALLLYRMVRRMLGKSPSVFRLWATIFLFNGTAIFLYMASGVRALLPEIIAFATGFNITAVLLLSGKDLEQDLAGDQTAEHGASWVPGSLVTLVCGTAVLFLELPCFWFSLGMGITLGREVATGNTLYSTGLALRAHTYGLIILPLLFVSAGCEAVAIQGMRGRQK